MIIAEQQLARIGFATEPSKPSCWRTTPLDGPILSESATEPAYSRAVDAVAAAARAQSPALALPHLPHRGLTILGSPPG